MIIAYTELNINKLSGYIHFFKIIGAIKKQLDESEGLVFIKFRWFKTLTGWESYDAMKKFRNHGPHLEAMKDSANIGVARVVTWKADDIPDWKEVWLKTAINSPGSG